MLETPFVKRLREFVVALLYSYVTQLRVGGGKGTLVAQTLVDRDALLEVALRDLQVTCESREFSRCRQRLRPRGCTGSSSLSESALGPAATLK
jgi:hypothetical protein